MVRPAISRTNATAYKIRIYFLLLSISVSIGAMLIIPTSVRAADIPRLDQDQIRVALFIDSERYKANTSTVTLSAGQGLILEDQGQGLGASHEWARTAVQPVRISIDQYMIRWLDTPDLHLAQQLQQSLSKLEANTYIYSNQQQGQARYEVYSGQYATLEAARNVVDKLGDDASLRALLHNGKPVIRGPHRWNAGTYATELEAMQQRKMMNDQGITAEIAYTMDIDGTLRYEVWVGQETDEAALATLQRQIQELWPSLQLQSINTELHYLIKKEDVTPVPDATVTMLHYWMKGHGQTLSVSTIQDHETIAVKEKNGRTYRGELEIQVFNNRLALINRVDLETYLYSVVSVEMGKGWPTEALKAQAIAARTYALVQGNKYQIAHISDSTIDQAYYGAGAEITEIIEAVQATRGLVIVNNDGLITPFYSSNAGGVTASPEEVYGNPTPYLHSVHSPYDDAASGSTPTWHQILLDGGTTGYITAQYVRSTGEIDAQGRPYYEPTGTNVNVRRSPNVNNSTNPPITQVNPGDRFVSIGEVAEASPNTWVRGPFTPAELLAMINRTLSEPLDGPLVSLEVTARGASGRATEIMANGRKIPVAYPDAFRGLFGGLPSTLFEIEQAGMYTIHGAGREGMNSLSGDSVYIMTGANAIIPAPQTLLVINGLNSVQSVSIPQESQSEGFTFRGSGNGHGLGMSQWGARGMAEQGADYHEILEHFYKDINIVKMES